MGKIVKFGQVQETEQSKDLVEESSKEIKTIFSKKPLYQKIWEGLEDYILHNFAVKNVLGMDFTYKENNLKEIGVLGILAYEHKRRNGTFVADFVGRGYIDTKKDKVIIDLVVFKAGERELYNSTIKILKAKKIYPELTFNEGE
ncbi:MAG TPA: hypothetical protein DEP48_08855 [Persephonella sp.]|uniref:Uncharacterized protein n=1 Tax=Persephonella marina (strain DSM 14350 / EX-H1) TaxID=123214 RepID=C0QTB4_PERMH|nr:MULTISPECIES: hypothetical protein [Persephonella]ACO03432.1 hypothetical protein PERMA_0131 [Persephonella marina EX-H1]HCB70452.1 hypothetical protein [Persephonella sp.]